MKSDKVTKKPRGKKKNKTKKHLGKNEARSASLLQLHDPRSNQYQGCVCNPSRHAQTTQTPPAPQTHSDRHTERSHEHSIDGLTLLPSLSEQRAPQPTHASPCFPLHSLASLAWSLLVVTYPLAHLSAASLVPRSGILLTVASNSSGRKAIFREKNETSNSASLTRKNYDHILHVPFHDK